ncbi:MAG: 4Fe-4S binding protein [Candidatus Njordarchaeia archaeon]
MVSVKKFLSPIKVPTSYLARRPFTVMYPREGPVQSDNWKGLHVLLFEKCIGCGLCAKICPNECIEYLVPEDVDLKDRKAVKLRRPAVDWGHCIFCGLCVDICPKNAIRMDKEFRIYGNALERLRFIATPYEIAAEDKWKWSEKEYVKEEIVEEIKRDDLRKIHYLLQTDLIAKAIGGHWEPILKELGNKWRDLRSKYINKEITEEEWLRKSKEIEEAVYDIIKASSVG